jgi:hypothetical protein
MQAPSIRAIQAPSIATILRTFAERRPFLMSVGVLVWSTRYLVTLALNHNTGSELYGVLTAALATGAAVANLALLRSPRTQLVLTAAVFVLWALIAVAGFAGTMVHIVGPVPGHGPMDLRPRPIAAPLVVTILGSIGAVSLFLGQRARRRALQSGKGVTPKCQRQQPGAPRGYPRRSRYFARSTNPNRPD